MNWQYTRTPYKPQIPAELKKSFGIGRIGQPIVTPSGQQFNRASPTAREQLWGYAEGLGQRPEDIMWQTQAALPQPRRGTRVAPARQRI